MCSYKEAARCRDLLSKLESSAKQAQALAAEYTGGSTFKPRLRLGQRIVHRVHGYRGVVVGWDAQCCEAEDWVEANGGAGVNQAQPFYHVLVDQRDWEFDAYQPPVAYVAEELCWTPEDGGPPPAAMPRHPNAPGPFLSAGVAGSPVPTTASSAAAGAASLAATSAYTRPAPASGKSNTPPTKGATQAMQGPDTAASSSADSEEDSGGVSWMEMFGSEPLEHPYRYILFLGQDARGDYMPCRQLRDKYSVRRRDVHRPDNKLGGGSG
ncbi:UVR domain-containing protein [Haematococcus lacustris]|uniref:UVR domain-containing protein n=1 Tax=Haematococcus lacustris TaxID=44745 RepID=A0A699Z607_HAELA|nr:UVR domain-containing protein [Haematococcus lacustris]